MPRRSAKAAAHPDRRYASMQVAAARYNVDRMTVRRWISSGLIHGYRMGGRLIKVDLDEIEANVVKEVR